MMSKARVRTEILVVHANNGFLHFATVWLSLRQKVKVTGKDAMSSRQRMSKFGSASLVTKRPRDNKPSSGKLHVSM